MPTNANTKKRTIAGTSKGEDAAKVNPETTEATVQGKVCLKGNASPRKKRAVSDDETPVISMEDLMHIIDTALSEHRIDEKKVERLHECLESDSWSKVAYTLLCEHIPLKRNGKGYSCRVCQVPKKGHTCTYCHVCSTPKKKYEKDDEHVCINCPTCFDFGKKNKKLIQVKSKGHVCPRAKPYKLVPV